MAAPFTMIPLAALLAPNLTFRTLKVYGAICSFRKDSADFCIEAGREEIASRCGFNASIVSTATTELQRLGWLIKQGAGGRGLKTTYTITIPETVSTSGTVTESETVPESVSKTVSTSGTLLYKKEVNTDICVKKPNSADTEGFSECWVVYPKREGGNSRTDALKAYRSRLKVGATPAELLAGVKRYAHFCAAKGIVGSPYVKQAASFFGTGEHWREAWSVPGAASALPEGKPKFGDQRTRHGITEIFNEVAGWVPA